MSKKSSRVEFTFKNNILEPLNLHGRVEQTKTARACLPAQGEENPGAETLCWTAGWGRLSFKGTIGLSRVSSLFGPSFLFKLICLSFFRDVNMPKTQCQGNLANVLREVDVVLIDDQTCQNSNTGSILHIVSFANSIR